MRGLALSLVVASAIVALTGCGSDQLEFQLADERPQAVERLSERSQVFPVAVEFGCGDEDAEIDGYDVAYGEGDVVVTFNGSVSYEAGDCAESDARQLVLDEPIGQRQLCDGSSDPPRKIWPVPPGTPPRDNPC